LLCKEEKPLEEFSKHSSFKNGRNSRCKACKNAEAKAYYEVHKDDILTRGRQYKTWRGSKYGLSREGYQKLVEAQSGCCSICGVRVQEQSDLVIDHCHKSNTVRGLLCRHCNLCLGHAKDNPDILRKAAEYLDRGSRT
jgi:hypothetical protein